MASDVHQGGMPDWGEDDVTTKPPAGSDPLLAELRHATGNLMHRMRYWTELLESESLGNSGTEALCEIRTSLDGLQELIAGTLDLLRPSEVRRIAIPGADVVRSIAMRFGDHRANAAALAAADASIPVLVDPSRLDRALQLLVEVALPFESGVGATQVSATFVSLDTTGGETACLLVTIRVSGCAHERAEGYARLHNDVNIALARKLLSDTSCTFTCVHRDQALTMEISLPLASRA